MLEQKYKVSAKDLNIQEVLIFGKNSQKLILSKSPDLSRQAKQSFDPHPRSPFFAHWGTVLPQTSPVYNDWVLFNESLTFMVPL